MFSPDQLLIIENTLRQKLSKYSLIESEKAAIVFELLENLKKLHYFQQ